MSEPDMQIISIVPAVVRPEDEKRWRSNLEQLGPEEVRFRLHRTESLDPNEAVAIIYEEIRPWPTRAFAEQWLRQMSKNAARRETRRYWFLAVVAVIAAIASCIAAFVTL